MVRVARRAWGAGTEDRLAHQCRITRVLEVANGQPPARGVPRHKGLTSHNLLRNEAESEALRWSRPQE